MQVKSTRWFERDDSPNWVVDRAGILLGFVDSAGNVHYLPSTQANDDITDSSERRVSIDAILDEHGSISLTPPSALAIRTAMADSIDEWFVEKVPEVDAALNGIELKGTVDQAPKINALILAVTQSASGRGVVRLPMGSICIKTSIIKRTRVSVRGMGVSATQLDVQADFPAFVFDTDITGGDIDRAGIYDLQVSYRVPDGQEFTLSDAIYYNATVGRIWKPTLQNVQVVGAPRDAVNLNGTVTNGVVEMYAMCVEITGPGRNGWAESYYTYDSDIEHLYCDGLSGKSKGYGLIVNGGSATVKHGHSVAFGQNDGLGNLAGGGCRVDGNFSSFYNFHCDRNAGHGFVIGSFDSEPTRVANSFVSCLGFNNGLYYGDKRNLTGTVVKAGANWKFGKVNGHTMVACQGGRQGSNLDYITTSNKYGVLVEGGVTDLQIFGGYFNSNSEAGLYASGGVPNGSVRIFGVTAAGNGIADVSGQSKFVPIHSKGMARDYWILPPATERTVVGNAIGGNSGQMLIATGASATSLAYINNPDPNAMCVVRRKPGDTGALTIVHGAGNIYLRDKANLVITDDTTAVMLIWTDAGWVEV